MDDYIDPSSPEFLESVKRLTRDLRNATVNLSPREARFLVDAYYAMQRDRIRAAHQTRTLAANEEPHDVLTWLGRQRETLEKEVRKALDAYSAGQPIGAWCRSIVGIGPVIAAGLIANIYVGRWCAVCHGHDEDDHMWSIANKRHPEHVWQPEKSCPTVGHIWRFAGLDPTVRWDRNTKRPWNGSLKRLCFLIGESFTKVSNNENDTYGKVYAVRKLLETQRNEAGHYADQAAASLAAKRFGLDTQARKHYEAGKLPPARIHLRAQRYAVKLFLSHLHSVWYYMYYLEAPPKPYILNRPEHVHFLAPPNMHLVPGLAAALGSQ